MRWRIVIGSVFTSLGLVLGLLATTPAASAAPAASASPASPSSLPDTFLPSA